MHQKCKKMVVYSDRYFSYTYTVIHGYTLAHTQTYRCTAYGCVQHSNMILVSDIQSYGIGETWVAQQYDLPLDIWSSAEGHADTRHHEAKREITTMCGLLRLTQ